MKLIICLFMVIGATLLGGCQTKKKVVAPPPQAPHQIDLKPVPFTSPADSVIGVEQLKSWIACNRSLDSLSIAYTDSFKTDDPALRAKYQHSFSTAQARLCLRDGLKSAYEEYRWVTSALAYPKNRSLAAQFNIIVK